jgi:hypothetical protein
VEARYGGHPLFRYVYQPHTPAVESPKPYFHPLYTLGGNLVTIFRPHDHPWHHGLAMTSAHLSDGTTVENFWGGPTFVREQGYVQLDNNGVQRHLRWDELSASAEHATLAESLQWVAHEGQPWLAEQRRIVVSQVDAQAGFWRLTIECRLTNLTPRALHFGSPTTAGRPLAGCSGAGRVRSAAGRFWPLATRAGRR